MISFGAPKVGDEHWRDWANSRKNLRMFSYMFEKDAVPAKFPKSKAYQHTGHSVLISARKNSNGGCFIYFLHYGCDAANFEQYQQDFCRNKNLKSFPQDLKRKLSVKIC